MKLIFATVILTLFGATGFYMTGLLASRQLDGGLPVPARVESGMSDKSTLILQELQQVGKLTTYERRVTINVPMRSQRNLWGLGLTIPIGKTELTYLAVVQIGIGVDLSKLKEVVYDESTRTIHVTLPPNEITSMAIVPEASQIVGVNKEWVAPDTTHELVILAQQEALRRAQRTACIDLPVLDSAAVLQPLLTVDGATFKVVQPVQPILADGCY